MKLYKSVWLTIVASAMGLAGGPAWSAISNAPDSEDWGVANGIVYAIVRSGDAVYLGGNFQNLVSAKNSTNITVRGLAALDANTGQPLAWRPLADGTVFALAAAPDGSAIYAGGSFTSIDGVPRARFAAIGLDGRLLWAAEGSGETQWFGPSR